MFLSRRRLRRLLDVSRIQEAIAEAERKTSGEIQVSIAPWFWGNLDKAAQKTFARLGVDQTRQRNGVLFFIVPARRSFVVLGDRGIHEQVGQGFWDEVAATLSAHFKQGEFTEGLLAGIAAAAARLEHHFPYDAARDVNELADKVDLQ